MSNTDLSNLGNGQYAIDQVRTFLDYPSGELPDCAPSLCEELPLAPTMSEPSLLLSDYVEEFEGDTK